MKSLLLVPVVGLGLAAARPALSTDAAPLPADAWKVDPVHSSVLFKIKHANASWFYGMFPGVSGTVALDAAKPEAGKIEIAIDAASVDTRNADRDKHLRGPDFFDAKQFPEIKFVSKKITKDGDGFAVAGEMTMRGETKPLSIKVMKTGEGEFYGKRQGYETTFTIKRSDFGMTYGVAEKVLGDEITVMAGIEGVQPEKGEKGEKGEKK